MRYIDVMADPQDACQPCAYTWPPPRLQMPMACQRAQETSGHHSPLELAGVGGAEVGHCGHLPSRGKRLEGMEASLQSAPNERAESGATTAAQTDGLRLAAIPLRYEGGLRTDASAMHAFVFMRRAGNLAARLKGISWV